ncbi:MAG: hypothetical protein KJP21_05290 [Bacteroidia bacterium]|nr:hypothetical protein [Bacteroidia bacterium]NNJ55316.1 hypothetical protein [Bacteroidia bacterium]
MLTSPDIDLEIEVTPEIFSNIEEEGQVIVHCSFHNQYPEDMGVRVWKSTFLICEESGFKSQLIRAFNVPYQPQWYWVAPGATKKFTMIFEKLPKSCNLFTFIEVINQPGPFIVTGIRRNNRDVYQIRLD